MSLVGVEASRQIGSVLDTDVSQGSRGEAGGVTVVAEEDDPAILDIVNSVLARGSQSPLEDISLDVDRPFQLSELSAVCLGPDIDDEGSGLHLSLEMVG